MEIPKLPIPSDRFQNALTIFEEHLKKAKYQDVNPPQWAMMSAALEFGFRVLEKECKLDTMFDTSNPFDLAMLAWCVEAQLRQKRKESQTPNPSLN